MPPPDPAAIVTPGRADLFLGFLRIGLLGFGGVAAWARRVIVEERRWLSERDYAEVLGLGQILPGPNVGNAAVMIGRRFHGLPGALLATSGMYLAPLCILITLSVLYESFGQEPGVVPAMQGIAAGAAGMVIGTALKMAERLKLTVEAIAILAVAVVAAAWLRISLPLIVVVLAPVSIALALRRAGLIGGGADGGPAGGAAR
ncbi:MAG: chromate transporter [Acetobacteraceae bacterium]|nr:chromate transporter [Acetobacteraceae bacterium]